MGWFDDQIKERKILDSEVFSDSFIQMAGAVMGSRTYAMLNNDRIKTKNAIDEILKFYRIKTAEIPDGINDVNEQLEYLLRPHGICPQEHSGRPVLFIIQGIEAGRIGG